MAFHGLVDELLSVEGDEVSGFVLDPVPQPSKIARDPGICQMDRSESAGQELIGVLSAEAPLIPFNVFAIGNI